MNMPFGERQYTAQDLGGHRWTFSQSIAECPARGLGRNAGAGSQTPAGVTKADFEIRDDSLR
jgi:hypothetical protein